MRHRFIFFCSFALFGFVAFLTDASAHQDNLEHCQHMAQVMPGSTKVCDKDCYCLSTEPMQIRGQAHPPYEIVAGSGYDGAAECALDDPYFGPKPWKNDPYRYEVLPLTEQEWQEGYRCLYRVIPEDTTDAGTNSYWGFFEDHARKVGVKLYPLGFATEDYSIGKADGLYSMQPEEIGCAMGSPQGNNGLLLCLLLLSLRRLSRVTCARGVGPSKVGRRTGRPIGVRKTNRRVGPSKGGGRTEGVAPQTCQDEHLCPGG